MAERSGSRMRYSRQDTKEHSSEELTAEQKVKLVPEGVEGLVEYKGTLSTQLTLQELWRVWCLSCWVVFNLV